MANAAQLKALLTSHAEGDDDHFFAVAMQIAAQEAKLGHGKLAKELLAMIDKIKSRRGPSAAVPIDRPRGELANLLETSRPKNRRAQIILDDTLSDQIQRIILEQRHASQILGHGLSTRRKLLLFGPPGTGKTLTASVLAGELGIPLFQVRLDGLITKYMGETAAKLRQIFDATNRTRGIYFFDEFDAIGSQRGLSNDVGEMRRVLNSFLQMIEQDRSLSLIIAATNHQSFLDSALFRRFDDILRYTLPHSAQISTLLKNRLSGVAAKSIPWIKLAASAKGLSHAEVARAADEVLKDALIHQRPRIVMANIQGALAERKRVAEQLSQ